jgi:hypothetical protein
MSLILGRMSSRELDRLKRELRFCYQDDGYNHDGAIENLIRQIREEEQRIRAEENFKLWRKKKS